MILGRIKLNYTKQEWQHDVTVILMKAMYNWYHIISVNAYLC